MKKRIISFLLVAIMIVGIFPVGAMAVEGENSIPAALQNTSWKGEMSTDPDAVAGEVPFVLRIGTNSADLTYNDETTTLPFAMHKEAGGDEGSFTEEMLIFGSGTSGALLVGIEDDAVNKISLFGAMVSIGDVTRFTTLRDILGKVGGTYSVSPDDSGSYMTVALNENEFFYEMVDSTIESALKYIVNADGSVGWIAESFEDGKPAYGSEPQSPSETTIDMFLNNEIMIAEEATITGAPAGSYVLDLGLMNFAFYDEDEESGKTQKLNFNSMVLDRVSEEPDEPESTLHTITVKPTEHGTVTVEPAKAAEGDTVTITVTPDSGYALVLNGLNVTYEYITLNVIHPTPGNNGTYTFTMPAYDVTVEAMFEAADMTLADIIGKIGGTYSSTTTNDTEQQTVNYYLDKNEIILEQITLPFAEAESQPFARKTVIDKNGTTEYTTYNFSGNTPQYGGITGVVSPITIGDWLASGVDLTKDESSSGEITIPKNSYHVKYLDAYFYDEVNDKTQKMYTQVFTEYMVLNRIGDAEPSTLRDIIGKVGGTYGLSAFGSSLTITIKEDVCRIEEVGTSFAERIICDNTGTKTWTTTEFEQGQPVFDTEPDSAEEDKTIDAFLNSEIKIAKEETSIGSTVIPVGSYSADTNLILGTLIFFDEDNQTGKTQKMYASVPNLVFSRIGGTEHEHTFAAEYSSNETVHWLAATCEHTELSKNLGEHTFGTDGKCTVCGYEKIAEEEHVHEYGTATYIWNDGLSQCTAYKKCSCGHAVIETVDTTTSGNKITADFSEAFTDQEKVVEAPAHVHTPMLVNGQAATCTADGWKDYYKCGDTGCAKLFSDPACTVKINNLDNWKSGDGKIGKLGHNTVQIPQQDPTTGKDGVKAYWYCGNCKRFFADNSDNVGTLIGDVTDLYQWKSGDGKIEKLTPTHTAHIPSLVKGQAPTCTADGWKDYYQCSDNECGKFFSDPACTVKINGLDNWMIGDGKIAKLGHNTVQIPQQDPTTKKDGVKAYWYCGNCKRFFADNSGSLGTLIGTATDLYQWKSGDGKIEKLTPTHTAHIPSLVKGQAATCTADGWKDYYECSDNECGELFSDPACTVKINDLDNWMIGDGKIGKLGHNTVQIPQQDPTTEKDGVKAYWYCGNCKQFFADNSGSLGTLIGDAAALSAWKTGDGKIGKLTPHTHTYGAATYLWNENLTTCTAYHSCTGAGCGDIELETVPAVKGATEITATFANQAFATQTVPVVVPETPHEHTFANEWSTNACAHWHASTCAHDGYNVIKDGGAHDFDGGVSVEGGTKYTCETCGYEKIVAESGEVCSHENLRYVNNGNGTHKVICTECMETLNASARCVYDQDGAKCVCGASDPSVADVKISVDVKEKTTKQFSGFLFWGTWKDVTTYTATIRTEVTGVKVTRVQYQLNGGRWTTGTSVSSTTPIKTLKVKAWDNKGNVHEYTYTKGN